MKIFAYAFFHLNLFFSSIAKSSRPEVVRKCYWPLLHLARDLKVPIGIEASAVTLRLINEVDETWVSALKVLIERGECEFIGSGYSQIIGPLVPARVSRENIRIGLDYYYRLLGVRPKVALVNEQAFSAGLVPIYLEAGFEALIVEWDNPFNNNPSWDPELRYHPQYAIGVGGTEIPIIWNKSVSFQKFQRLVHEEIDFDDYTSYLTSHLSDKVRAFPIYGNDAEVFDFRPGRYGTELPISKKSEWETLRQVFMYLLTHESYSLVFPSGVLGLLSQGGAGRKLKLESTRQPVLVKKQEKYNLVRWALTGRDDLGLNTACWRQYVRLLESEATDEDWQELCYLWSSDFRTHITQERWDEVTSTLRSMGVWGENSSGIDELGATCSECATNQLSRSPLVAIESRHVVFRGKNLSVRLNCARGLSLDSATLTHEEGAPLIGTLPHGYFDDIKWSADFYSGHLVYEPWGGSKITDLVKVTPIVKEMVGTVVVAATIDTAMGPIIKEWEIDDTNCSISLRYWVKWSGEISGRLRLGFLTLIPESFRGNERRLITHNGGTTAEEFIVSGVNFDHGESVSLLVSSSQAFSMSEGLCLIGDENRSVKVSINKTHSAAVAMAMNQEIKEKFLTRLYFSILEHDDTSKPRNFLSEHFSLKLDLKSVKRPIVTSFFTP